MNCIPTPERIVAEWAEHGLVGLDDDGAYRERHIDAVMERLNANTEATVQNATHRRLMAGLDALGHEHRPIVRNASLDDDPAKCGYCPFGCQNGCKRSGLKTWLQDASDDGAAAIVNARADRILVEDGRANGVEATVTHADGSTTAVTVETPTVVVACGSVESPALLMRSGIGGPAVGKNLRLHPAYLGIGTYEEPVEGWNGQIQSLVSDAFDDVEDGCGFLIEAVGMTPGLIASAFPWESGADHKRLMQAFRWHAPFVSVARDHGSGEVTIDDLGRPVVSWGLGDPVDRNLARRANVELCRIHHAAGASEVFTLHRRKLRWRQGEDFDAFLAQVDAASYAPNDIACLSAHQMGSCRMGSDPETSVADGNGELTTRGESGSATARLSRQLPASIRWSRSCRWPTARPIGCWPLGQRAAGLFAACGLRHTDRLVRAPNPPTFDLRWSPSGRLRFCSAVAWGSSPGPTS